MQSSTTEGNADTRLVHNTTKCRRVGCLTSERPLRALWREEPGFVAGMTFSMVVVAGNALMYLVCSEVADRTRFIYVDDREVPWKCLKQGLDFLKPEKLC